MNSNADFSPPEQIRLQTECLPAGLRHLDVVEFSVPLHVAKYCGREGAPDHYTVAVACGTQLQALCHRQPLAIAIAAITKLFESVSMPQEQPLSTTSSTK